MKKFNKMLSVVLSLVLCLSLVAPALAVTYDITKGDVNVTSEGSTGWDVEKNAMSTSTDKDITIVGNGEATKNTIKVEDNVTADITLDNVNIKSDSDAALSIGKDSNVTVNLEGGNTLASAGDHAGLELNGGNVTITTGEGVEGASLTANGGVNGAGIGVNGKGDITIDNSKVMAQGNGAGAGIGVNSGSADVNISIKDSDVTAGSGADGAAIGGSYGEMKGNITIEDSKVNAEAGANSAGIGRGGITYKLDENGNRALDENKNPIIDQRGSMTGNISITGEKSDVFAGAGWSANGIGLGGNNGNITIEDGKVTGQAGKNGIAVEGGKITITDATVGAYTTERGDAIKGANGGIVIDKSTVTATSKAGGAAIGGNGCGDIAITGSTVKATSDEVAIGGNGYGTFGGDIVIDNSEVTAISKGETAIGGGGPGMSGTITIANGAVVTAVGGKNSAIGRDRYENGEIAGENGISIDDKSTVVALTNDKIPAILRNDGEGNVLNGQFDDTYFKNTVEAGKTKFTVVNADGDGLLEFDVKVVAEIVKNIWEGEDYDKTFQSFGIVWPEGAFAIKDEAGNYVCYMNGDDKMVKFEASQLTNQGGLTVMESQVNYSYAGEAYPEGYENAQEAYEKNTTTVKANGGTWTLTWDGKAPETTQVIDENGKLVDVEIVGTWVFVEDPSYFPPVITDDDEVEIDDVEVPLAGLFTRADAIGYLWEQSGSPEWELSDFEDVPEDHYWAVAIGWAQDMGIAVADEDGNFRPDDLVLRSVEDLEIDPEGELQEFLNRYAVYAGIKLEPGELFIELDGAWDDIIMGEEAQVIFDDFFAKLELALTQAA